MRRIIWVAGIWLHFAGTLSSQQVPRSLADTGFAPTVFGTGTISSGEVYRGSFAPDGRIFYFFKKTGKGEDYRIFVTRFSGSRWSEPDTVKLGGDFSDLYPAFSPKGDRLVFSSYRPFPTDTSHTAHIWYANRAGNGWGEPVPFEGDLAGYYHSWVEIGPDGAIHFRRTSPDWRTTESMVARADGSGGYLSPVPFEPAGEARRLRPDLTIAGASPGPEGLVFLDVATRDSVTGRRGSDIWIMRRGGKGWSPPHPLGAAVNSPGYDVFPFLSPDGTELFFVRDFRAFYRMSLSAALESAR